MCLLKRLLDSKLIEWLYVDRSFKALERLKEGNRSDSIEVHNGSKVRVKVTRDSKGVYSWTIHTLVPGCGYPCWEWRKYLVGPSANGETMKIGSKEYPAKYNRSGKYVYDFGK